jgi:transcriptional regulator with XRE-family HTH domain
VVPANIRDLEADVGPRLRARREEARMSLRELARRLGISPSAVSQIETGKSRPSVSTLYGIASELAMSLDELFSSRPSPPSPSEPQADGARARHVQRAATRKALELESGVRWERLTPLADPEADFLYLTYDVGGSSSQGGKSIRHSGREYGLVLSGTLEVTVGDEAYELGPGDAICFDSTVPHRLRNLGPKPAQAVWFVIDRDGAPTK